MSERQKVRQFLPFYLSIIGRDYPIHVMVKGCIRGCMQVIGGTVKVCNVVPIPPLSKLKREYNVLR